MNEPKADQPSPAPANSPAPTPANTPAPPAPTAPPASPASPSYPALALRSAIGGVLMGLANLVPGISGGTMLLAAGVYRAFIAAVAEVSTLRFRPYSIVVLGSVVAAAALAIVLLAGPVKDLVVDHRWVMYALFIGLTLGGVPLVYDMLKRAGGTSPAAVAGFLIGLAGMAALAFLKADGATTGSSFPMLFLAGIAGASAMILPGISGGYLLLVLGQYVPILASVDRLKDALTAGDPAAALAEWTVVLPVGLGVVVGIAGLSNLIKWLLHHRERPTLGLLLGLLVGSVLGLYPFQHTVPPAIGDQLKGGAVVELTTDETGEPVALIQLPTPSADPAAAATTPAPTLDPVTRDDWPTEVFTPSFLQLAAAAALTLAGLATTLAIARLGRLKDDEEADDASDKT